ncbi:30S ribosomal protein S12 methylthiotransferase RimO [Desulfovibrio sp. OttesenSCG-928-F07]|nr:30S ribosomal protein S12 methylthiotransferase RimO [Desulfovibrio sp. OttesenSCG-928-F07]
MLNIYPVSLGCPKNRVDTERILGSIKRGTDFKSAVRVVKHLKSAHVVLINTCAFITPAIQESVSTILECAEQLKRLPKAKRPLLAVAGCLPGRFGAKELAKELPEVDLWLETAQMEQWAEQLLATLQNSAMNTVSGAGALVAREGRVLSTGPSYAWLKISEGCGQQCAFCTIPYIRGKVRSSTPEFIADEAKRLIDEGVKEIALVAQDLTSWGRDLNTKSGAEHNLRSLLERLVPLVGLKRLRLMYLYPAGLTDDLLAFIRDAGEPLLPYFDVPLQHAHPDILTRMGRPFSQSPFKVVERIRSYLPQAALRTSLITGFPGETDEQFATLCNFVQEAKFQNLGVFSYYAEDGTVAAAMPNQLPDAVKDERRDHIMQIQAEISAELLEQYNGQRLEILIDAPHPEWPGLFVGRTWFQAPEVDGVTYISGENLQAGDLVSADITETFDYDLNALV